VLNSSRTKIIYKPAKTYKHKHCLILLNSQDKRFFVTLTPGWLKALPFSLKAGFWKVICAKAGLTKVPSLCITDIRILKPVINVTKTF
jgi:hypothetical protein